MNRKIKVFATLSLCALSAAFSGCGNQPEPVVNVTAIKGNVTAKTTSAKDFATVAAEQKLCSGDAIKTGDESSADIEIISDKSQVRLSSNTFLEIRNFTEKELRQISGIAIYKITPQNRELKIQTPQGMATVLGTVLRIDSSDTETTVCVEQGKVGFSKKANQQILIEAGMKYSTSFTTDAAQPIDPFELEKLFNEKDGLKPIINPR
ncbi:MAG: hypothetical protein EOM80_10190 [Erysipelotrichia bacterium]|nr:FecR family protein [Candidatus Riflebacteria bacterium]NCB39129.1 hypothetical protein [Erysipelotrichia bacterium]